MLSCLVNGICVICSMRISDTTMRLRKGRTGAARGEGSRSRTPSVDFGRATPSIRSNLSFRQGQAVSSLRHSGRVLASSTNIDKIGAVGIDDRLGCRKEQTLESTEEDQRFIVLAIRKPRVSKRTLMLRLKRTAERTSSLSLRQEPPRITR